MGVSRHTIREAIEILEDAGVLAVEAGGGGARVASIWMPESLVGDREPWAAETVSEALEARRVIEPRVAQLARSEERQDPTTDSAQNATSATSPYSSRW